MVALDGNGNPLWRCTGTILSSEVFLTAGHCLQGASNITIWFDADVQNSIPKNGYPEKGEDNSKELHIHPNYNPRAFWLHDLGIAVLEEEVDKPVYGTLPEAGLLNKLVKTKPKGRIRFEAVGYGLQYINPVKLEEDRIRYVAYPKLIQINTPGFVGDFSILITGNANTGGAW